MSVAAAGDSWRENLTVSRWGRQAVTLGPIEGRRRRLPLTGLEEDDLAWGRLAELLGADVEQLRAFVREGLEALSEPADDVRRESEGVIYARGLREPRSAARRYDGVTLDGFREAVADEDAVWLEWPKAERALAVLDVDWHGATPAPPWAELTAQLRRIGAQPGALWRSRGGGLHALYEPLDGLDADQLAACAAVELASLPDAFPGATFEVIARTRRPDPATITWQEQRAEDVLDCWRRRELAEVTAEDIAAYRQERGWEARDAEHSACPFEPSRASARPGRRPVFFGDFGVSCLSCQSRGLRHFVSWAALIDGEARPNRILTAAERLVDWSHARHILAADLGAAVPDPIRRRAYLALARLVHGADDPRPRRLVRNPDGDFVRGVGCWLDPLTMRAAELSAQYHHTQPANTFLDGGGAVRVDVTAVNRARNDGRIPGWPALVPVRGIQLWGMWQSYPSLEDAIRVTVHHGTARPPRYVDASERDVDGAWAELEARFPGLVRPYLELLLVARGAAESGAGRVPRILVTGPSGSAKSTTVRLAAAILGDEARTIAEGARFREALDRGIVDAAGFLLCDEFGKPARGKRAPQRDNPFAPFLAMESRHHQARLLYIGPVAAHNFSAVVITGTQPPPGMVRDLQLARRFVHVELMRATPEPWERSCGFADVANTRAHLPDVCDAILSDVVDRWFTAADASGFRFEDVAAKLGWPTLQESQAERHRVELPDGSDFLDPFGTPGQLLRLFELVCSGEGCHPPPARFRAEGRRRFGFFDDSEVAQLWRELADGVDDTQARLSSERVAETDLAALLGVDEPVRLEVKGDYRTVCLRFHTGRPSAPEKINRTITTTTQETPDATA